jgi:hypothetical protein
MLVKREWMLLALLLTAPMTAAAGNVITDWDEKAVSIVQTGTVPPPPTAFRTMAILHVAMFDAVNSIETQTVAAKNIWICSIAHDSWRSFR